MSEVAKYLLAVLSLLGVAVAYGCAVPVAPTGGEPDRSGPLLISSQPANGTVEFRDRVIQLTFDDFVDRNSFASAFRIEPGIATPYDIKWRRKTASIHLLRPLPENTTVVFTVGTELKDTGGNSLKSPLNIAVSTGPEINSGEAKLRITSLYDIPFPDDLRVFLYKSPFKLDESAFYLGQPDTSGTVTFNYLADGEYASFLVHDLNRNRIWDAHQEYAQPTAKPQYLLENGILDMGIVYYAERDTTPLKVESIGLLSKRRLRLEFSKPLPYRTNSNIMLETIENNVLIPANLLFIDTNNPNVVYFHAESDLADSLNYRLYLDSLQTESRISVLSEWLEFQGSSEPDTSTIRFHSHMTQQGVRGIEPFSIKYSGVLDNSPVADSVQILINREPVEDFLYVNTDVNILRLTPTEPWNPSDSYIIRVWDPDSQRHIALTTQILDDSDFGELSISIPDTSMIGIPMKLRVFSRNDNNFAIKTTFVETINISDLPEGIYTAIIYPDPDGDGEWDPGAMNPYRQPEPISVTINVPVRGRMTGDLEVKFD